MAISFRSSTTNTKTLGGSFDLVINKPAGTVDGDLMIAVVSGVDGAEGLGDPAGWTQIIEKNSTGGGYTRTRALYRIASSEGSSYTWSGSDNFPIGGIIATYTGAHPSSPIGASPAAAGLISTTSPVAPTVTTTVANSLLICAFMPNDAATMTPPSGMTERADIAGSAGQPSGSLNELLVASPGATGTKTATSSIARTTNSISFVINPAPLPTVGTVNVYFPLNVGNVAQGAVTGTGWSVSTVNQGGVTPPEVVASTTREGEQGVDMNILTETGEGPTIDRGAEVEVGGTETGWTIQLNLVEVLDEEAIFEGEVYHGDQSDMSDETLLGTFDEMNEVRSQRITSTNEDDALKRYIRFKYTIVDGDDPGFVVAPVIVAQKVPTV